jgi:hypothetical protein
MTARSRLPRPEESRRNPLSGVPPPVIMSRMSEATDQLTPEELEELRAKFEREDAERRHNDANWHAIAPE